MVDGASSQTTEPVKKVPEEYMLFSRSALTKELAQYAAKNIQETEEIKAKCLREIREYIKREFNPHANPRDNYLLLYLRSKKYDMKKTTYLMKTCAKFIEDHPYVLKRDDFETVQRVIQSKLIGFLPYRDAKGRGIILLRSECWKPDEMMPVDLFYGVVASLQIAADNEINQVAGFVCICDFKNLSLQQMVSIGKWIIWIVQALQKCCPYMVKEFHVLHTPALVRAGWKLIRTVLSEKLRNRVTFYKSPYSKGFHSTIPPAILPEELGGELGPYSPDHWSGDMQTLEKRYKESINIYFFRNETT